MSIVGTTQALTKTVSSMSDDIARALRSGAAQNRNNLTKIAVTGKEAGETLHNLGPNTYNTDAYDIFWNFRQHLDATNSSLFQAVKNIGVDPRATVTSLRTAGEAAKQASIAARQLSNVAPLI